MKFPAQVYREQVLEHIFADAQRLFLSALLRIDRAHLVMLHSQEIITRKTAAACMHALQAMDIEALRTATYDGTVEDLFFLVEARIAEIAGNEDAGRLHTARSRNDIDLTMYRMVWRQELLTTLEYALALRSTILRIAHEHRVTLMPAHTHSQPAQPTTLGHYMMAMVEILERDTERALECYARVNRSPLGACAITTTGFPIDRHQVGTLLGFRGLLTNSYGAIASVDYLAETCSVVATTMLNLGRFTQDMVQWSTVEFGFLRLSDAYVQISSIMPQKRNPVPLEHTRILASRALNEAHSVLGSLHNTPFADMNDGEDSLQPLVALAFTDAQRALALLAGVLTEATFDIDRMRARASRNFITVTEVADTLVRQCGLSFQAAHSLISSAVRRATNDDIDTLAQDLYTQTQRLNIPISLESLRTALDPEHFIAVRRVIGGPAPFALDPELDRAAGQLKQDESWLHAERTRLATAENTLKAACEELLR
jgi:argininosuccinate lyase